MGFVSIRRFKTVDEAKEYLQTEEKKGTDIVCGYYKIPDSFLIDMANEAYSAEQYLIKCNK